jgi:hypothetical protein
VGRRTAIAGRTTALGNRNLTCRARSAVKLVPVRSNDFSRGNSSTASGIVPIWVDPKFKCLRSLNCANSSGTLKQSWKSSTRQAMKSKSLCVNACHYAERRQLSEDRFKERLTDLRTPARIEIVPRSQILLGSHRDQNLHLRTPRSRSATSSSGEN